MSLLEAAVQGPAGVLGIAVGWVGARYVGPVVGKVLRPVAKTVIKGALVVNDEVDSLVHPQARARTRRRQAGVAIAVAAKSTATSRPRGRRSRMRPASEGTKRTKHTRHRKAHANS